MAEPLDETAVRMRREWDARAAADARHFIYTRDGAADVPGFEESGSASYNQLVRPYLPVLLEGRPARSATVAEIGCGIGRMTRAFAREFGNVHALDVSPVMLEQARAQLAGFDNVRFHLGAGYDLASIPDGACDLVFSYIVFQHIPSREAIAGYVRDAARVLRPGGVLKFQVNGDQSPEYRAHVRDTWLGETFSPGEATSMLDAAGLTLMMAEGPGTQYFILTARKGPRADEPVPRPYIFPGEPWAEAQLLDGWGEPVDRSWRRAAPVSRAVLRLPGPGARFFIGLYIWPEDVHADHTVAAALEGRLLGRTTIAGPGDHYVEFPAPAMAASAAAELSLNIAPGCDAASRPAVRAFGLYVPAFARPTSERPGREKDRSPA